MSVTSPVEQRHHRGNVAMVMYNGHLFAIRYPVDGLLCAAGMIHVMSTDNAEQMEIHKDLVDLKRTFFNPLFNTNTAEGMELFASRCVVNNGDTLEVVVCCTILLHDRPLPPTTRLAERVPKRKRPQVTPSTKPPVWLPPGSSALSIEGLEQAMDDAAAMY